MKSKIAKKKKFLIKKKNVEIGQNWGFRKAEEDKRQEAALTKLLLCSAHWTKVLMLSHSAQHLHGEE